MKPQQNSHQHSHQTQENSSGSSASATSKPNKASFVCKSSTTRWTPTSDQIRILKELYYNQGIRSPNAEQIQGISARLRRYGRIEGKNVFYWFQNHKARERQKIKFRKASMAMQRADSNRPTEYIQHYPLPHVRYITTNPGKSSSCSVFGQMGSEADEMERSFRDFSIYPSGCGMTYMNGNRSRGRNDEDYPSPVVETLPLFPMHDEETDPNPIGNEGSFSSDDESWLSLGYGEQWND